jgi:tripartite-type tricarboxylate transporter receptor subunit TctC
MNNSDKITTHDCQRRNVLKQTLCLGILLIGSAQLSFAQAVWPTKPINLVVPFAPGGTTDVLARAIAQRLSPVLGQPVVVENKAGAGATLGAAYVAKAAPDGYTLLMGALHHTIATSIYKNLTYDFEKDLAPISVIAFVPNILVVNANLPVSSVKDLIALAKQSPGKMTYGSAGNGTAHHLIGEQFQLETGTQLLHIPYKGSGPMGADLLGGQINMTFDTITPVMGQIKAGKLKPLAVMSSNQVKDLPDVPTMKSLGYNIDIGTWFGLLAPAATPPALVARINSEVVKIVQSAEFKQQMADIGAEAVGNTSAQMAQQIKADTEKFAALIKTANLKLEVD